MVTGFRNVSNPMPTDRPGPARGRKDVVASRRVVAGCDRRPRADEDRARVADPRRELLGVVAEHDEMLGSDGVHLGHRRSRVSVHGHDAADGVRTVLGLRGELELDDSVVGTGPGQHDDLGRAGGQIDRDLAARRAASPRSRICRPDRRSCPRAKWCPSRTRTRRSRAARRAPTPRRGREAAPRQRRARRLPAASRRRSASHRPRARARRTSRASRRAPAGRRCRQWRARATVARARRPGAPRA